MHHRLKINPKWFDLVISGKKRAEVRKNDRLFESGDTVTLREFDVDCTGRTVEIEITHVLYHDDFPEGLKPGYCVFSFMLQDYPAQEADDS